ncbi:Phosphoethanolamine transferase eptA [Rickettsiales bacterium Ac37b]|nr:Phosphoethanolamine transferase eptA [Rickettsiales bacterium Ac37b]
MNFNFVYHRRWFIFVVALIYTTLFNLPFILKRLYIYNIFSTQLLISITTEFIISCIITWLFFYTLTINKKIFVLFTILTFIITALAKYFLINLGLNVNISTISAVFATDLNEAKDFFNIGILTEIIFSGVVSIILVRIFDKYDNHTTKFQYLISLISLTLSLMGIFLNGAKINAKYYPYNILKEITYYALDQLNWYKSRTDIANIYKFHLQEDEAKDLIVVLVIGESARFDHFGINGYNKPTTPYLSQISNLLSFQNVEACAAMTMDAVPCIMTRSTNQNRSLGRKETSFVSIMRKLGFNTLWLGSQGSSSFNRHYYEFGKEAEHHLYVEDFITNSAKPQFDVDLLPYLEKFVTNHGKKLIIFHSIGSHFHYDLRAPSNFQIFIPRCKPDFKHKNLHNCSQEQIINSYDNSILYTDFFLSKIINLLEKKNALFFYISDHGESLGENGIYMHGNSNIKEQIHIPMFVFASENYIKNHPAYFNNMQSKLHSALNQDNIFHSILDCSFITSDIINKNLSICQK